MAIYAQRLFTELQVTLFVPLHDKHSFDDIEQALHCISHKTQLETPLWK